MYNSAQKIARLQLLQQLETSLEMVCSVLSVPELCKIAQM
jgi:hypothetical protein